MEYYIIYQYKLVSEVFMGNNFWREYFSIPNLMGYFRIALVGVYMYFFYNSMNGGVYWPVIATIVLSGMTDFFDGKVARRFNMVTEWGKVLDPIADKITIGAIILSLTFKYKIVMALVALYVIKEGFMGIVGLYSVKKGHKVEGAMWYGKVCTFGTYVILLVLLLFPNMPDVAINALVIANSALMIFTLANYVVYYGRMFKQGDAISTETE